MVTFLDASTNQVTHCCAHKHVRGKVLPASDPRKADCSRCPICQYFGHRTRICIGDYCRHGEGRCGMSRGKRRTTRLKEFARTSPDEGPLPEENIFECFVNAQGVNT